MLIHFYKYHGAGNDFIILDNRTEEYNNLTREQIAFLCHRRFGIGADGLMLLNTDTQTDFAMRYFNSDGGESTLCGNGGRCITAFAKQLGLIQQSTRFMAIDGAHEADIREDGIVTLAMHDVNDVEEYETYMALNTGSPHYVSITDYVNDINVAQEGRLIRNSPKYRDEGINVNFAEVLQENHLLVRTYERGVEDETLSCGTGVTASAIAYAYGRIGQQSIKVTTPGGELQVDFMAQGNVFTQIYLSGPAQFIFTGSINLP